MIIAKFSTDGASGSITMEISGHGGGKLGQDLVCAGASTLAYTAAQSMEFMYSEDKLMKKPNIRIRKGEMSVTAKPRAEDYAEALHVFFVAQVGIHLLATNFPDKINLIPFDEP